MKTMWDHSKAITSLMFDFPSQGVCEMHGMDSHVCLMYTCSADRSLRLWDLEKYENVKTVQAKS